MATSLLNISQSGLRAASLGLATTSHNIANVNTAGYSRQEVVQAASLANRTGAGYAGTGVDVTAIQRIANSFLTKQAHAATSDAANTSTAYDYLTRMAELLTSDSSSISASMDRFFSSIQDLAAQPSGVTQRQAVLSQATAVANQYATLDNQLSSMSIEIGQKLQTSVNSVNSMAVQVAKLNDQIALQIGAGFTPNDLLDQRDALIRQISGQVKVSTVDEPDGRVNVFLPSGDPLVLGNDTLTLTVQRNPLDPDKYQLAAQGAVTGNIPRTIQATTDLGGAIGGMLASQDDIITARNELGRMAIAMADAINTQQGLGRDLNGNYGQAMFSVGTPKAFGLTGTTGTINVSFADTSALQASDYRLDFDGSQYRLTRLSDGVQSTFASLPQTIDGMQITAGTAPVAGDTFVIQPTRTGASGISSLLTSTNQIAAAAPIVGSAASTNTGNGAISALTVDGPTPNANLTQTVQLTFTSATAYDIVINGSPAGSGTVGANGQISINGWTMTLSGTPAANDSFTVANNTAVAGDNRNLNLLSNIASSRFVGGMTLGELNSGFVGRIGNEAASLQIESEANDKLLTQIEAQEQSVSGVNLDEEAANLIRYQQAYQAAAKAIAAAQAMFDTILSIGS